MGKIATQDYCLSTIKVQSDLDGQEIEIERNKCVSVSDLDLLGGGIKQNFSKYSDWRKCVQQSDIRNIHTWHFPSYIPVVYPCRTPDIYWENGSRKNYLWKSHTQQLIQQDVSPINVKALIGEIDVPTFCEIGFGTVYPQFWYDTWTAAVSKKNRCYWLDTAKLELDCSGEKNGTKYSTMIFSLSPELTEVAVDTDNQKSGRYTFRNVPIEVINPETLPDYDVNRLYLTLYVNCRIAPMPDIGGKVSFTRFTGVDFELNVSELTKPY